MCNLSNSSTNKNKFGGSSKEEGELHATCLSYYREHAHRN